MNCSIVYSAGIYALDEKQTGSMLAYNQNDGLQPTERMKLKDKARKCTIAFVQEANSHGKAPINMELIANFSDRSPLTDRLRTLRLLNSPKGYSFRAYLQNLRSHF